MTVPDLWRPRDALADLFVDSFDEPPGGGDQSSRRGESENRDKDGSTGRTLWMSRTNREGTRWMRDQPGSSSEPRGLCADRLSDHPLLANFSAAVSAYRRAELADATATDGVEITDSAIIGDRVPPPAEVLPEPNRKDFFNRRRREDPLGEGQPCTWRSRLIKVACEVFLSIRRVVVKLASSWPHLDALSRTGTLAAATKTSG